MRNTLYVCEVQGYSKVIDEVVFSLNVEDGTASRVILGEAINLDGETTVNISDADDAYSIDVEVEDIDLLIEALKKAKELHAERYAPKLKKPVSPKRAVKKS